MPTKPTGPIVTQEDIALNEKLLRARERLAANERDSATHLRPVPDTQERQAAAEWRAVQGSLDSCVSGQEWRSLFDLARELQALPWFGRGPAAACAPTVAQWHAAAEEIGGLADDFSIVDARAHFARSWKKVRYPAGKGPIDAALARSRAEPKPKAAYAYEGDLTMQDLVALCYQLQREAGAEPFYLSCRAGGKALGGLDLRKANRYLNLLVDDGVLEVIVPGTKGAGGKATRYRFTGQH